MAAPTIITASQCCGRKTKEEEEQVEKTFKKYREEIIPTLPRQKGLLFENVYMYQGCWYDESMVAGAMYLHEHFQPRQTDVLLATSPKCGTTWLKGLIFSIMNRATYKPDMEEHPLLTNSVHECVPFLEVHLLKEPPIGDPEVLPSPRLLCTHVPYTTLPEQAKGPGGCRIVHIWRNPKDAFISTWHFVCSWRRKAQLPDISLEEAFDLFSQGTVPYGPFWDLVLGYWKASQENPNKVLLLKYEDMKKDTLSQVRRLAEFLGKPFTKEEEERCAVEEIIRLCSFESMSKAAIPNEGKFHEDGPSYQYFFRKGEVGGWKNVLSGDMVQRFDEITKEKFKGSGLEV